MLNKYTVKCSIFVATLPCLLSTMMTLEVPCTPAEVRNQIVSYVNKILKNIPTMRNSSCFEIFFSLFNGLADRAKDHSQICQGTAILKLQNLTQRDMDKFKEIVEKIENLLKSCTSESVDGLEYFKCLIDIADQIKCYFQQMKEMYVELLAKHAKEMEKINEEQVLCLQQAIDKAKLESDRAYKNLKQCITSGNWPSSSSAINDDQQLQVDKGQYEDKTERTESLQKISIPTVIAVPVGLAIVFCAILIATVIYKSKKNIWIEV